MVAENRPRVALSLKCVRGFVFFTLSTAPHANDLELLKSRLFDLNDNDIYL